MKTAIVVHPDFERSWPFVADHLHRLLRPRTDVSFTRLSTTEVVALPAAVGAGGADPDTVERLFSLGVEPTDADLDGLPALAEAFVADSWPPSAELDERLGRHGVRRLRQPSEGYWAQSVAEYALGLTICGLRRIPQQHAAIVSDDSPWQYAYGQFGDDPAFSHGTVAGKRVRIVGAGNIASRYASWTHMLGADVAAWDPYATEPSFHRSGARREWHLTRLLADAEIFAPMVPLNSGTEGLVTAEHVRALPKGCLVVLVTRATICDVPELRRRVLADELSLAADVFDVEPLPLDDPLLGRHNVVHTPHNAGRTLHANLSYAELLAAQLPD
ncbi:NAD(P)-dependent oxidoreductase [Plantactinospora endophytica]|uniref:D-isomer specific 2-hydroxyacid dehydrogenase NAD-binding domain-containing protein n=1 Tax=Plantactinospora endophytica TaxID=673535 RepID=A0ABQ4E1L1_9ACTN|nr:NAD(P)-dependent oxidoreductase [Plantactinospora endophytica]GIG88578.1 hypothetical protein Pen02_35140 [Plantactinospora endophytica]